MNEKFKELYKYLSSNNLTDLSESDFYNKYSDPSKASEIHSYLSSNNMTDLSESDFFNAYFSSDSKKKEPTAQSKDTESTSEGSSSVSPFGVDTSGTTRRARYGDAEYIPDRPEYMQPFVYIQSEKGKALGRTIEAEKRFSEAAQEAEAREEYRRDVAREESIPASRKKYSQFTEGPDMSALQEGFEGRKFFSTTQAFEDRYGDEGEQYYEDATTRATVSDMPQLNIPKPPTMGEMISEAETKEMYKIQEDVIKLKKREEEKLFEERNKRANLDDEFLNKVQEVKSSLIGKEEEEVIDELTKKFSAYGFSFEQTGIGDAMIVRNADGTKEITIDLDPFFTSTEISEAKRLRDFITANAQEKNEIENEDFIRKSLKAQILRKVPRINEDGSESEVLMTSVERDGKHYALPTLFPKDPDNYTSKASDWMEVTDINEAIRIAKERGELFAFDTAEEAKSFADGSWKGVNTFDVEADIYYKNRGLDYFAEKKKFDDYEGIKERMSVLQSGVSQKEIPLALKIKYKEYFGPDGRFVMPYDEAKKEIGNLNSRKQNLLEQVYDAEFTESASGSVQDTREKFDIYLQRRQDQKASEAAKYNLLAKEDYDKYNELSQKMFGVDLDNVSDIIPEDDVEKANLDMLKEQLVSIRSLQKTAALKYEMAKTYFDAKWNKEANEEYLENWEGFKTAVVDAWENGKAAEQILIAGLGIKDVDISSDRKEIAEAITRHLSSVDGRQSLAMTRLYKGDNDEAWKAFLNDPLEVINTVVVTSFAQMLPYGLKIVPATTLVGAGTGAAIGSATGPQGTVGGVLTGGAKGLRAGIAATSLALEYTNAVMDAMREKGYNLLDPSDVERALLDDEVWSEGKRIGLSRGIPIAAIDYISGGIAGNVFKTSKLASKGKKITAMVAERAIVDPASEATGEYLAQVTAGQEVDGKEIALEALGGFGNNTANMTANMAVNLYKTAKNNTNQTLVDELTSVSGLANISATDRRISSWANNMEALGKIDSETNQRIQENVGLRREARDVVNVGRVGRVFEDTKEVEARVMELLSAKKELTSTNNRRELFRDKISEINKELQEIANTRQLRPDDARVNLDNIIYAQREGLKTYKIGGKNLTKSQFLSAVNQMSDRRLARTNIQVLNDDEVLNIYKDRINAIQERETGIIPDAERAEGIQEMEEGVRVTPEQEVSEVSEEEVTDEEVSSKTLLEQEVEDFASTLEQVVGTPDKKGPRFRTEDEAEGAVDLEQDVETITEKMNAMPEAELIFTFPDSEESVTNVNPVAESLSAIKLSDEQAAELGYRNAEDISRPLQEMDGLPMIPAMSDILGAGVYNDSEGNPMEIDGGLLFNVLGKNKNAAWAGVDYNGANKQLNDAIALYEAHKPLFEKAWEDGRLPYGHVPMAVMRMANSALNSNEAVFRFVKPTIDKVKNQEAGFKEIQKAIEEKTKVSTKTQGGKNTVASALALQDFISRNNITTVSQLIDSVISEANKRAKGDKDTLSLPNRGLLADILFSEGGKSNTNQKAWVKAMLDNKADSSKLTFQTIYNSIGEKSMIDRNQGEVVAIVGIDVLNPEVIEVDHANYGYGPKGRIVQLVSNPMHGVDVFPEWKAKTTRVYKKDKKGKFPDSDKTKLQTGGAFFQDKIFRGAKLIIGNMSKQDVLIGKLRAAFPNVYVAKSKEEFDYIMSRKDVRSRVVEGNTVLGMTIDGKIYLNPEDNTLETPIHEFGHIWIDYLRSDVSGGKGGKLLQKGLELARETNLYQEMLEKHGDPDLAAEETLVELMATKGKMIDDAAKRSNFMNWLNAVFKYIKENFTSFADLKVKDIESMSIDDFIDVSLGTLLAGKPVDSNFKPSDVEESARARFSMYSDSTPINEIIRIGRSEGFSDEAIAEYLKSVRKFKVKDINEAMKVQVDLLTNLPNEFGNVEGGVQEGRKLFLEVRSKLNRFATAGPRGGRAGRVTKTMGEIRAKAMELLRENPIFQAQNETTQMELMNAFDKTLETRANRNVQAEINAIRNNLKQRKIGAKELSDAKRAIRNIIRKSLPKSNTYTKGQIDKLMTIINGSNESTILADVKRITDIVNQQRDKMKKAAIKDILNVVSRKPKKTSTGKRRGSGVMADTQSFFTQAKPIVQSVMKNDMAYIEKIQEELSEAEAIGELADAFDKFVNEESLTNKELQLVNKAIAMDFLSGLNDMTLEEVNDVLDELNNIKSISIAELSAIRKARALDSKVISEQATAQIKETNKVLFNEDGSVKSTEQRRQDRVAIRNSFMNGKIWSGFKELYSRLNFEKITGIKDWLRNNMSHLETLSSLLDDIPNGKTFFTDNIYRPLNRMDENAKMGYFRQKNKLDELANSIDGITKGYKQIISMLRTGVHEITIKGKKQIYNADQLLRVYALSKNDVQRAKLENMGFTDEVIEEIKRIVGPEAIQFADNLVDYFSNEYFDSINNVYKSVNDVNLGFVENYFPTMTESKQVNAKLLQDGDFNGVFNAETSPALKERTATEGDILLGFDFTDVVESHIVQMEKYKAYAEGVKKMNAIFKNKAVDALLTESGMMQVYKRSINYAITPNAGNTQKSTIMSKLMTKFTGFALSFKAIQILKQATSFVNAYEDYQFLPNRKVPVLDLIMFMADTAVTIATLPKQIKNAYNMSANVRDRLIKGVEGDVYGLESGSNTFTKLDKSSSAFAKFRRAMKTGAAGPTVLGDIMGVMGYMTNYRRNIRNGMSPDEALEAFNNYNATQQSRRGTEKIAIQQNNNDLSRAFTMFGSTSFLQLNKVIQSWNNIIKSTKKGKIPRAKDVRSLALNAAVANVLFVGAANLAKFIKGDDEDREQAIRAMMDAAMGLNILYNIPLVGAGFETAINHIRGERKPVSDTVNPFISLYWKIDRGLKEESVWRATQPIAEIALGAQFDPFIGMYNMFGGDFNEDDVYAMLGISKSYRPSGGSDSKSPEPSKAKPMTKTDMKNQMPEVYEMLYGKDSDIYKTEQMVNDIEKNIQKQIDDALKDAGGK